MSEQTKSDQIESMINDLLAESDLGARTVDFVESLAHQYEEKGWLHPAQTQALEATWSEKFGFKHNR